MRLQGQPQGAGFGYVGSPSGSTVGSIVTAGPPGPTGPPGPQGPPGTPGTNLIRFSAPTAVVGVSATDRAYSNRTLKGARMRVSSAPAGSDLVVVVQHWDGMSWVDLGTLTIPDGSVVEATSSFSRLQFTGNMVRVSCTSVGSISAATGVAVDVIT